MFFKASGRPLTKMQKTPFRRLSKDLANPNTPLKYIKKAFAIALELISEGSKRSFRSLLNTFKDKSAFEFLLRFVKRSL